MKPYFVTLLTAGRCANTSIQEFLGTEASVVVGAAVLQPTGPDIRCFFGKESDVAKFLSPLIQGKDVVVEDGLLDGSLLYRVLGIQVNRLVDIGSMSRACDYFAPDSENGVRAIDRLVSHYGHARNFSFDSVGIASPECEDILKKKTLAAQWLFTKYNDQFPKSEFDVVSEINKVFANPPLVYSRKGIDSYWKKSSRQLDEHLTSVRGSLKKSFFANNDELLKAVASQKFSEILEKEGVSVPKGTSFSKDSPWIHNQLQSASARVSSLLKLRLAVTGGTLERSRIQRIRNFPEHDSSFPIGLKYGAAITSRIQCDSRDHLNFQGIEGKSEIKEHIMCKPGHAIIACDFSKIELVTALYLVGDSEMLGHISSGVDPYRTTYANITGITPGEVSDQQRAAGKELVLAGIFGASGQALKDSLYEKQRILITLEEANKLCKAFRERNVKIVNGWNQCEVALQKLVDQKGDTDVSVFDGKIHWNRDLKAFILPSGLQYPLPNLRREDGGGFVYGPMHSPERIWPSKMFQNIVQGCGRSLLSLMIQKGKDLELRLCHSVHDSAFWTVPADQALNKAVALNSALKTPPDWAKGMPLAVDTEIGFNLGSFNSLDDISEGLFENLNDYSFLNEIAKQDRTAMVNKVVSTIKPHQTESVSPSLPESKSSSPGVRLNITKPPVLNRPKQTSTVSVPGLTRKP